MIKDVAFPSEGATLRGLLFLPETRTKKPGVVAGSGLECVVQTTCFVADPTAFPKLNDLYAEYFPSAPPSAQRPL